MSTPPRKFPDDDLSRTYTLGKMEIPPNGQDSEMALLALSHTAVEHALYTAMLGESLDRNGYGLFDVRRLMKLAGLNNYSAVRRGRNGLLMKKSIEAAPVDGNGGKRTIYKVFSPPEIFSRRRAAGLAPYPEELDPHTSSAAYAWAIERVLDSYHLSRREAQVALACTKGLTNSEIGAKLSISEQTVKFHLSHIFIKLGVKRRAELISRLLAQVS